MRNGYWRSADCGRHENCLCNAGAFVCRQFRPAQAWTWLHGTREFALYNYMYVQIIRPLTDSSSSDANLPPISSQTSALSGGKTKVVPLTRGAAPTLTPVSSPRRGAPRPMTSTTQRISKRAQFFSSIVSPKNLAYLPRKPLASSPHYSGAHGGNKLIHLQCPTVAALSSTRLRFPENDAALDGQVWEHKCCH